MRIAALLVLSAITSLASAQTERCQTGADLTRQLDDLRARHGDEHPDVLAVASQIRDLQRALLAEFPGRTLEEICDVPTAAASEPTRAQSDEKDPNEVICRREQVTGSHRRREVCMTRAERENNRRDTQERMRERRGISN